MKVRELTTPSGVKIPLHYREGTSDERVIKEVLDTKCYRRKQDGFDVKPGERWLDLGANIGAFAAYALCLGARHVECWEPDPDCFELLKKSMVEGKRKGLVTLYRSAITNVKTKTVKFYKGISPTDHYRATIIPTRQPHPSGELRNTYAPLMMFPGDEQRMWDGVKMDIEGSEFGLIEDGWIPKCDKLVLEYHLSRDKDMANFRRRRDILKKHFDIVYHIPSLNQQYPNDRYPGQFDRFIYCWNRIPH